MKVVQINVLAKNKSTGRTTEELHKYLIENGHDSYVAYGIGEKLEDKAYYKISNFFDYYSHNILSRIFGNQGFYSKHVTKKLIKWLDKIHPDVVHLRNLHSNYINLGLLFGYLKKNNIPTIFTTHDFWLLTAFCPYPFKECDILCCDKCPKHKGELIYNASKNFQKKKDCFNELNRVGIQANSYFSKSVVERSFLRNVYTEVIYNWINFKSFYPEPVPNLFNTKKPVILSVWSLLDEKQDRFQFFVKIANLLNEKYSFVMVGSHSFNENKYPNIKFLQGTNDVNELRKYYSSADLLFNPSTTDTFGKVVAESISCGTPCVVFNNQALPELVGDNECGIVVEPFDVDGTIHAIEEIISKSKAFYSDKCFSHSRELFDLNNNCKKLVSLYERVIKNEK